MNTRKLESFMGLILTILLAGCGGATPEPTMAPTQSPQLPTATPVLPTPVPEPTPEPTVSIPGGLQPLSADECGNLASAMMETLAVGVETTDAPIENSWSGQQGTGCQLTAVGTGLDFDNTMVAQDAMKAILQARGWVEEMQAPMCLGMGGWGPGATTSCFTQADRICEAFVYVEPLEDELCSGDEPITACLSRLTPEQRIYTVILTCAQGYEAVAVPQPEPLESDLVRIQFAAGTTSAQVQGSLAPGELDPYVLTAMAGQEMTVNLSDSSSGVGAILIIWGADGTVLISDHADATSWQGELPLSQDYYIDVRSIAQDAIDYVLEVTIPPAADSTPATEEPTGSLQPLDSATCSEMADAVAQALGVPATTARVPFTDHVNNETGTGCLIAANGTGVNFENIMVVESALIGVLQARGWQENIQYMGGGPGAVLTGYEQGDALCLALAYWEPSEDANCPPDQPVSACELTPEQQLYTITLNCVQGMSAAAP